MPILRAVCPECKAGLKSGSPNGFKEGETIECPKCGTYFAAEDAPPAKPQAAPPKAAAKPAAKPRPQDDDEDDRPKKKASRRDDDDDEEEEDRPKKKKKGKKGGSKEGSYKSSPARFVILGILVLIMLVAGFFLYQKMQAEKEEANKPAPVSNPDDDLGKPIRQDPNAKTGGGTRTPSKATAPK